MQQQWVYLLTENEGGNSIYTVGFFDPEGKWNTDSDGTQEECAKRVHYLNGGKPEAQESFTKHERGALRIGAGLVSRYTLNTPQDQNIIAQLAYELSGEILKQFH